VIATGVSKRCFVNEIQQMTDMISLSKTSNLSYSRSATGENWQLIMMSCTSAKCDPRSESNQSDCGSFFAYIYFVAFYMICSFLVSAAAFAMIKCQTVHKSLFAGDYHRIAYIFRSSIYSWQSSWITLII
jgi:hypothetical protein